MHVVATKSEPEREDEEASRLVREAPKDKPPRRDRRRERMEVVRDPDTAADPDLTGEDTSLNYKSIGGSALDRLALRFVVRLAGRRNRKKPKAKGRKQKKIPAKSKETGETVFIAPDTLKTAPGKYEKLKPSEDDDSPYDAVQQLGLQPQAPAPAKGEGAKAEGTEGQVPTPPSQSQRVKPKDEPSDDDEEYEEVDLDDDKAKGAEGDKAKPKGKSKPKPPPMPTVAQGLGIKPPKQRKASAGERAEIAILLADTLPPKLAAKLIAEGIHPDDAKTLMSSYKAAGTRPMGNPAEFAAKVATIYQTDPDKVEAPKTWRTADGKQVAFDKLDPEAQATAYREHQMQVVAMSHAAHAQLEQKLSFGKTIPPEVVKALVTTLLAKPMPQSKPSKGGKPKKAKKSKDPSDAIFAAISETKGFIKIPEGTVKTMMASIKGNDQAQKILQGFLEGNDYKRAKDLYLGDAASERDEPHKIAESLKSARDFFQVQGGIYGTDGHQGAKRFESKVLAKLKGLEPEKYAKVRRALDEDDAKVYDKAVKTHAKAMAAHQKAVKKWQASSVSTRGEELEPPEPPVEPAGYSNVRRPEDAKRAGRQLWDDLHERSGPTKTAALVSSKYLISSYLNRKAMDRTSEPRSKRALYHGISPALNYPREAYPRATQIPSRELAESDHERILASARQWLSTAVLTQGMTGLPSEQKARFALDLALSDGAYNLDATLYDVVLAKLQGVTDPGSVLRTVTAGLEEQIFHKFPLDSKSKSGGRLNVMLTGAMAKALKKPSYSTVVLDELPEGELQTLAAALRIKTANNPGSSFASAREATPSTTPRQTTETVNMLRLSSDQKTMANQSLATLDKTAQIIQTNAKAWGIPFKIAKEIVNRLDKTADAVETLVYGESSLRNRQAEIAVQSSDFAADATAEGLISRADFNKAARVIQRDSDEPYMDTFKNPMKPIETDADEPYMSAYKDDQSAAVYNGEDVTGRDLAP